MRDYSDFFKHCPGCGEKTTIIKSERMLSCSNCDFIYFLPPSICNAVIIYNSENEILLGKRKHEPRKGKWDLVGGFVEFNETLEESVIREVLEETGLNLKDMEYQMSTPDTYDYKGLTYKTLCVIFIAKYNGENFIASDDVEELRFFKKDEIDIDDLAFDATKLPVKKFFQDRLI